MGKRLIPFGASGGAAGEALSRFAADHGLRAWLSDEQFEALLGCTAADQYAALVEQIVSAEVSNAARE